MAYANPAPFLIREGESTLGARPDTGDASCKPLLRPMQPRFRLLSLPSTSASTSTTAHLNPQHPISNYPGMPFGPPPARQQQGGGGEEPSHGMVAGGPCELKVREDLDEDRIV